MLWENTTNETVLQAARDEIWASWRRACAEHADHPRAKELFDRQKLPAFHDPFAGGGALPLEAQRLGLEAYASDLNPVAVLINKAMIEIPPKFAGNPPVNPESRKDRNVCAWSLSTEKMVSTFGRQAIPMIWDYCEANPLSDSGGSGDRTAPARRAPDQPREPLRLCDRVSIPL